MITPMMPDQMAFGYECDENGKIKTFSYDSLTYMLSQAMREKVTAPIKKPLTTTKAIYDIVVKNADLRSTRQTEVALAAFIFSTLEEFVGVDLPDTEEGSHLLPKPLTIDPDSNLDSQEPPRLMGRKIRSTLLKTMKCRSPTKPVKP